MNDAPRDHFPQTEYFTQQVMRKRSYLRVEWCERIVREPIRKEVQDDGRIRHWGWIEEMGRYLRVVTLDDGRTLLNAFPDRNFKP